jgi:hypothetical protein
MHQSAWMWRSRKERAGGGIWPSPLDRKRCSVFLVLLSLFFGSWASSQESPFQPTPPGTPPAPPGLIRLGPFYLTPTLHVGTLGLDSNVFYTATSRQTDFTTSGGPGLDVVLPIGPVVRLFTGGDVNYVYFLRTVSQRKLGGDVNAGGEIVGERFHLRVEDSYTRSFQRPNYQVDERILQNEQDLTGKATSRLGHFILEGDTTYATTRVDSGQTFAGTNLSLTMSRNEILTLAKVGYGVTAKTSLVAGADYEVDRFPFETTRDADSNHVFAGLEITSDTRLSGKALGGVRLFRLRLHGSQQVQVPYADVDLTYVTGPRTQLKASYSRDLGYSAFNTSGVTPTVRLEAIGAGLIQGLWRGLDLRISGTRSRFITDGAITLVLASGQPVTAVRDDHIWQGTADLGYKFRSRLRMGVAATYVNRRSTFTDFGIQGLIVGGTVTYDPKRH